MLLALLQSTGLTYLFHRGTLTNGIDLIPEYSAGRVLLIVLTLTAGTAFIMWLGELITQRGVGNGMSLIIFVSIVSQMPAQFLAVQRSTSMLKFSVVILMFLLMTAGIIFVDQGQRRIPIQFSKRVRGRRVLGGQSTYIPLKVNTAGVIPIIFASSMLYLPAMFVHRHPQLGVLRGDPQLDQQQPGERPVVVVRGPVRPADRVLHLLLHRHPVRSGPPVRHDPAAGRVHPRHSSRDRPTTQYLQHIISRITLPGSLFLALVAVLPSIVAIIWGVNLGFSGVSILIVVGVALETMKQIESQLMMRNYEGFLS